jgi:hypothetical protein
LNAQEINEFQLPAQRYNRLPIPCALQDEEDPLISSTLHSHPVCPSPVDGRTQTYTSSAKNPVLRTARYCGTGPTHKENLAIATTSTKAGNEHNLHRKPTAACFISHAAWACVWGFCYLCRCGRQTYMRNESCRFGNDTEFNHNHGARRIAHRTQKINSTYNRTGHSAKATVTGKQIQPDRSRAICLHCGGRTGATVPQHIHSRHSTALPEEQKGQVEAA